MPGAGLPTPAPSRSWLCLTHGVSWLSGPQEACWLDGWPYAGDTCDVVAKSLVVAGGHQSTEMWHA